MSTEVIQAQNSIMEPPNIMHCSKCSKQYCVTTIRPLKGCIPLSLPCKHTMCDMCIRFKLKLNEQLKCELCEEEVQLSPELKDKDYLSDENFYKMFPVNMFVLGQLTVHLSHNATKNESQNYASPYINVKEIIEKTGRVFQNCSECKEPTCYNCVTCKQVYCDKCFLKVHRAFESLKSHTKEEIGFEKKSTPCQAHPSVDADFYCDTCKKAICMSCLVVGAKECASHKIDHFHDRNLANLEKFKEVHQRADEIFRRLTKTSVDIGNKLDEMYSSGDSSDDTGELVTSIRQHYAKLHACLQQQEKDKLEVVRVMSETDRESLEKARASVGESIATVKMITNKLGYFLNNTDVKVNILDLVEEMEETINNTSWYLHKLEQPDNIPSFKMNAEIFKMLEDHLNVSGDMHRGYTLLPTKDVNTEIPPAPSKPVFPPEVVVMDVRMKDKQPDSVESKKQPENKLKQPQLPAPPKPKKCLDYVPPNRQMQPFAFTPPMRSISGSLSSINSIDSGSMGKNIKNSHHEEPLPLEEGSTEVVYLAHTNDPGDFYMHRACQQRKLRDLKCELASASSFPRPSPQQVMEGNLYLSLCRTSNKFQRCRVLAVTKDNSNTLIYCVFYIDFGPTDWVTINELRVLPLQMTLLPALAVHCQLFNVRPVSDQWHPDDIRLMHRIANNKKILLYVRRNLGANALGLAIECDLTTFEDKVNVARALEFQGHARFIDPDVKYEKHIKEDMPNLYYNPDMKKNSTEDVIITCIVSPDKFFVRKHYLESQYDKLTENLHSVYGDLRKNHTGQVFCPEVGMVVACYVNLDAEDTRRDRGEWRRGVVVALAAKSHVLLSLPDSGHQLELHASKLRRLHQRFFEIKALAVECHLSHISPVNKRWSRASVQALDKYSDQKLKAFVDDPAVKRRSMGVRLYDDSDPDNEICINEEFIKCKYAVNIGALSFTLPKPPKPIQDKVPVLNKRQVKQPKVPEMRILQKLPASDQKANLEVTVDRGPVKLEVKILSCQSPSQLYVSLVSEQETLLELYEQLHTFYEQNPPQPQEKWQQDDKCCVLDKKAKIWKRAIILSTEDKGRVRVFYTDFAVVDEVTCAQILPLVSQFQDVPNGAFKCHLRGIMPAGGTDWPGITCELLNDLIEQYSRFFITKKGSVKDKSMPVELWVYHVTPGGALEPSKGDWRLLNNSLIEKGLAIPDRDAAEEAVPDDTLSLLSATGTVSQWLQLRPSQTETAVLEPEETVVEPSPKKEKKKRIKTTFKCWLPAKPITVREFECVPTFVSDDGYVYLHDANNKDILDIILVSINYRYQNSEIENTDWQVNDPCIAVYSLNDNFYRGRVLQVFDQTTCSVEFVDYGNVEVCSVENMRRELVTSEIPIQTHKCKLSGVTIVGGKRRQQAIEYAHKLIVERTCTAKILGLEDGVYNIELYLRGQSINKLLIETQFATSISSHSANNSMAMEDTTTDSDPDFIVEDEDSSTAVSATDQSLEKVDWNKMIDEESGNVKPANILAYPQSTIPTDSNGNFKCIVEYINDVTKMHVSVCDISKDSVNEIKQILDEIQVGGASQPVIGDLYPMKPCIALFGDDGVWYRAIVLQQDPTTDQLKVSYVDYGNSAVIPRKHVRECTERWCSVAPRMIAAELHNVKESGPNRIADVSAAYNRLLMNDELVATLMQRTDSIISIELRKEAGAPLVYQELIDEGLILRAS